MKKAINLLFIVSIFLNMACEKEPTVLNNDTLFPTDTTQPEIPSTADIIYDAVTDIDGNHYNAVRIGEQIWMASNLRTTRFADGEEIDRYIAPNGDINNVPTYGYLYEWLCIAYVATSDTNPSGVHRICPDGWHMPSEEEWTQLVEYVGTQNDFICSNSTNIAKALASNSDSWYSNTTTTCAVGYDVTTNNATGFSALPAGWYDNSSSTHSWHSFGFDACFWTSSSYNSSVYFSDVCYFNLNKDAANVRRQMVNVSHHYPGGPSYTDKYYSVRCVQD